MDFNILGIGTISTNLITSDLVEINLINAPVDETNPPISWNFVNNKQELQNFPTSRNFLITVTNNIPIPDPVPDPIPEPTPDPIPKPDPIPDPIPIPPIDIKLKGKRFDLTFTPILAKDIPANKPLFVFSFL